MSEDFGSIIGIIIALPFCILYVKKYLKSGKMIHETVDSIENEPFRITPQMRNDLARFSVDNATELRQMNVHDLVDLLSCSSRVLRAFEERLIWIDEAQENIDRYVDKYASQELFPITGAIGRAIGIMPTKKRKYSVKHQPLVDRLMKQREDIMIAFDEELMSVESVLRVIPERYRMSIILDTMCGYLTDGEVDSWEGCIKTFKEDLNRLQQNEQFNILIGISERIEKNTKAAAFFSGLTYLNTI